MKTQPPRLANAIPQDNTAAHAEMFNQELKQTTKKKKKVLNPVLDPAGFDTRGPEHNTRHLQDGKCVALQECSKIWGYKHIKWVVKTHA